METSITQDQLKDLIKAAVVEALEDVALACAIEEGESTELIERAEIFNILEGEA